MMQHTCFAAIRWYQRVISPRLGDRCRYEPTCSQYALLSIEKYGVLKGVHRAAARLLSCGYWSQRPFIDYP